MKVEGLVFTVEEVDSSEVVRFNRFGVRSLRGKAYRVEGYPAICL